MKKQHHLNRFFSPLCRIAFIAASSFAANAFSAVLPEETTELLFHEFSGGGVTINGPSILVRKNFKERASVWVNHYVDSVTSASVDVLTQGSPYTEDREQQSIGFDFLTERSTMSVSYTQSIEDDYEAETVSLGFSQSFFGDLTTVSLGYTYGDDIVMRNGDEDQPIEDQFQDFAEHHRYRFSISQILTKSWILSLNSETVVDEGFLNNPYRSVRYVDSGTGSILRRSELYPRTRNSDAFAIRSMYYLPYRAALRFEARTYADSWDITSTNYELRYIHPIGDQWVLTGKFRQYDQEGSSFYSDLFPNENIRNFEASDKEMGTFSNSLFGIGIEYEVKTQYLSAFDKVTLNLFYDRISFDYEDYRDKSQSLSVGGEPPLATPGQEPLYQFDANVIRAFVSFWY